MRLAVYFTMLASGLMAAEDTGKLISAAWQERNLGEKCHQQGRLDEAAVHFRSALKTFEALQPEGAGAAITLRDLAGLRITAGDHVAAMRYLERSLAIHHKLDVPDAALWNAIGEIEFLRGRKKEAGNAFARALASAETHYSHDSMEYAVVHVNLGMHWRSEGRHAESARHFELAAEAVERGRGPNDIWLVHGLNLLGYAQLDARQHHAAGRSFQRAIQIAEAKLPPTHPHLGEALRGYAAALRKLDRKDDARAFQARADSIPMARVHTVGWRELNR